MDEGMEGLVEWVGGCAWQQYVRMGPSSGNRGVVEEKCVCVSVRSLCIQLCMCGSVAAGRLYANYRAGGGEGVWQRLRLGIGLHALGYREPTTGLGWAPHGSSSGSSSLPKRL